MSIWQAIAEPRIVEAQQHGVFGDLEGKGRPIADLHRHRREGWWVRRFVKAERDRDRARDFLRLLRADMAALWRVEGEEDARSEVASINERIIEQSPGSLLGPFPTLDEDDTVRRWRELQPLLGRHHNSRESV